VKFLKIFYDATILLSGSFNNAETTLVLLRRNHSDFAFLMIPSNRLGHRALPEYVVKAQLKCTCCFHRNLPLKVVLFNTLLILVISQSAENLKFKPHFVGWESFTSSI